MIVWDLSASQDKMAIVIASSFVDSGCTMLCWRKEYVRVISRFYRVNGYLDIAVRSVLKTDRAG